MAEPVVLKKYSNRRLYDTERSGYVTLDQVADMIKDGRTVEIIDEKTKEDVTGFILTQIMVEESKKNAMWPVSLLHLIIRDSDNVLSEFFGKYLEQTIEVYLNSKKSFESHFRQWLDMGMNFSETKKNPFMDINMLSNLLNPFDSKRNDRPDGTEPYKTDINDTEKKSDKKSVKKKDTE